jgi:hypothetical protein
MLGQHVIGGGLGDMTQRRHFQLRRFHNALFIHGDICNIKSLKPFDILYGFNAANCSNLERHMANLWNQANPQSHHLHGMSECPNPKHLLSDSDFPEIWDLGFQDIAQ